MGNIITFTTDFGLRDPYQGAMKGVALSINPDARLVDITHLIEPCNILAGAFALDGAYSFYPRGTVHVGVVDPGVGGERNAVIIEAGGYFFVGPDNGLFSLITGRVGVDRVIKITNEGYFLNGVSSTFHGRDIFAPVAAHLSLGKDPSVFGVALSSEPVILTLPRPSTSDGRVTGEVIYIDSYGNAVTNIEKDALRGGEEVFTAVEVNGYTIDGIRKTYASVEAGEITALMGSFNLLEIAVNAGRADDRLGIRVGDRVILKRGRA